MRNRAAIIGAAFILSRLLGIMRDVLLGQVVPEVLRKLGDLRHLSRRSEWVGL